MNLWRKYLERTLQNRSLMLESDRNPDTNPEDVMIKVPS